MARTFRTVDGKGEYTIRLAGRKGEALESYWAGKATARETLNTLRGKPDAVPPSDNSAKDTSYAEKATGNSAKDTKSELHKVEPTPEGFAVVSGTSGRRYLVAPLVGGGAACSCDFGQRQTGLRVACSHVRAVEAWVLDFNTKRREAAAKDPNMVACWFCDKAGEVEIRPVYEARREQKIIVEKPRMERCLRCNGLGYIPKGDTE